jgi:prevent-host-death family protein
MKHFTATEAKNRFGEMLEMSAVETVIIEKNGRDVAVLLSKAEYDKMAAQPSRKDLIKKFHEESMQRFGKVYEALAK